tara:strand:+ start:123713 stop:124564 length:852 start_codon:yes stop_codon:yes gene_type:complete
MPLSSAFKVFIGPLLLLTLLLGGTASADNVDRLIGQLSSSDDYKVRISAALSLSKLRDQRAVWPFVKALKDSDKTVRGVAAASLGKIVNSTTSAKMQARVLSELKKAASSDSNSFVRKQAQKAFDTLGNLGPTTEVSAGGIYVNIGQMSAKTEDATKIRTHMRKTVLKTFKKEASAMMIDWPGGKDPSKRQISQKKVKAFHVDGTINELKATVSGSSTTVSCKVSMLIASYPEKSMFGFLKGGAQVRASSSPKEVQYAKEDCVAAVMEDLVARKIIPTIKSRP